MLRLALDNYASFYFLFGADASIGIAPAGATAEIARAIDAMPVCRLFKLAVDPT